MQSLKRPGRTASKRRQPVIEPVPEYVEPDAVEGEEPDAYDSFEMYRVICPDCAQPIALLADEEVLPEHALCASPWNPFGHTVCSGTGRDAADARPADEALQLQEQDNAIVLTLPQELDWRMQPFSHVGGPGSRPVRFPTLRRQAGRVRQDHRQAA